MASQHPLENLKDFKFVEVIGVSAEYKCINVLLERDLDDGSKERAVVLLEKKSINEDDLQSLLLLPEKLDWKAFMHNDIYGGYNLKPEQSSSVNEIKTTIIVPADNNQIEKYRQVSFAMLSESPEDYQNITLPYLKENKLNYNNLKWVYDALEGKAESERRIHVDEDRETGYLLFPDMKWDGQDSKALYCQVLITKRNIKSVRDLTPDHLPLLEKIRDEVPKIVGKKYGMSANRLRLYFHYQPSFFHLHVHIVNADFECAGQRIGQSLLLQDVIENIKLLPNYYQQRTITFQIKMNHPLYQRYVEAGKVTKI